MSARPAVGVFGMTGCAGDQLVILNCENELQQLFELLEVKDFLMASSGNDSNADLDIAFVEGAVVTSADEKLLQEIRQRSRTLVAIGTCAVWGGLVRLGEGVDRAGALLEIYGPVGLQYRSSAPRALREAVPVDFNISGCPIEKSDFLHAISDLLNGNPPLLSRTVVCHACKIRENNCLLLLGQPCFGPVTLGGCEARCPSYRVPCQGCRGPAEEANADSALSLLCDLGLTRSEAVKRLTTFSRLDQYRPLHSVSEGAP
jgi:sulfhydrogenase subunit delta